MHVNVQVTQACQLVLLARTLFIVSLQRHMVLDPSCGYKRQLAESACPPVIVGGDLKGNGDQSKRVCKRLQNRGKKQGIMRTHSMLD